MKNIKLILLLSINSILPGQFVYGDITTLQWQSSVPQLWGHSASFDIPKNRILFYGGRNTSTNNSVNSYFLFNTELQQLTPVKNGHPSMFARHWHTSVFANQKVYIFGGESAFNCLYAGPLTDVWEATVNNSLDTVSFMQLASMPLGVHRAAGGFHNGLQRIFITGGQTTRTDDPNPGFTRTTQIYDPVTNLWVIFSNSLPTEMAGGSLIYHPTHNNLFLIGTFYPNGNPTNRILRWESINNSWVDLQVNFNGATFIPVNSTCVYSNYAIHCFFGGNSATQFTNCQLNTAYFNSVTRVSVDPLGATASISLESVSNNPAGRGDLAGAYLPAHDVAVLHGGLPNSNLFYVLPSYSAVVEWAASSPGIFYNWIIPPRLGANYFIEITTNPIIQGGDAFMFWGKPVAPINYNGAIIHVDASLALNYLGQTSLDGRVSWTTLIPNNSVFVGITFSNQILVVKNSVYKAVKPVTAIIRN